jgi:hypothetical protein
MGGLDGWIRGAYGSSKAQHSHASNKMMIHIHKPPMQCMPRTKGGDVKENGLTDEVVRERGNGGRDGAVLHPQGPPLHVGGHGTVGHQNGVPEQVAGGDGDRERRLGGAVQRVTHEPGRLGPQRVQREAAVSSCRRVGLWGL